jgi:predicted esterase YcpF (UPF0227 family)
MILYLHGFRSSPNSTKAKLLREALAARGCAAQFDCPQLPASPRAAIELLLERAAAVPPAQLALIGSSLGGYYATWIAEHIGCAAALLNPAIRPYDDLRAHLGAQPVFNSDAVIDVRPEHLDELRAFETARLTRPQRYFLLAATGDEVIDYNGMLAKYAGCRQHVIDGSDHSITDFNVYLDEVLDFCFLQTKGIP